MSEYDQQNENALDALGDSGAINYVHARSTLCINPTPEQNARFDALAHRGLIRKNKKPRKRLVVDHGTADRSQFEDCIEDCNYGNYKIEYTT